MRFELAPQIEVAIPARTCPREIETEIRRNKPRNASCDRRVQELLLRVKDHRTQSVERRDDACCSDAGGSQCIRVGEVDGNHAHPERFEHFTLRGRRVGANERADVGSLISQRSSDTLPEVAGSAGERDARLR